MEYGVNSESNFKYERKRGLVALCLSMVIPVIYVTKKFIFKGDIKTWLCKDLCTIKKFESLLQGPYADAAILVELCVGGLALIALSKSVNLRSKNLLRWKILLLSYVIYTSAWCFLIATYLTFFILWEECHTMNVFELLCSIFIYAVIILHVYFAVAVFKLCFAPTDTGVSLLATPTQTYECDENFVDLHYILPRTYGRKSCPSLMYGDLLRRYEPYFREVNEEAE